MRRRPLVLLVGAAVLVAAAAGAWLWRSAPSPAPADAALPETCRALTFEAEDYVVCEIPRDGYAVSVGHNDGAVDGAAATVSTFLRNRRAAGETPLLAMNAGMYDLSLAPIGLLVEDGRALSPINLRTGNGNFYLQPNGVFFVDPDGRPGVLDSAAYAARPAIARSATQSGPLLVRNGRLHPALEPNGTSRYRRNGVGVRGDVVILAVSRRAVSFGAFARLFRDALDCPDALFLDGAVSTLAGPEGAVVGGTFPAGPVLVVERRR